MPTPAKCRLVYQNLAASGVFLPMPTFLAPINTNGWANLTDPSPSSAARLPAGGAPNRVDFYVDLLSSQPVDTVALLGTSLLNGNTFAAIGFADLPTADPQPITYFSMSAALLSDRTRCRGNAVLTLSGDTVPSVRYVQLTVFTSDPYVDIGQVVVGAAWRPTYNFNLDYGTGRNDLGSRQQSPATGVTFDFHGAKPRLYTFTLGLLSQSEVQDAVDNLDYIAGATRDVLFIPDDSQSYSEMSRYSLYGSCRPQGEALAQSFFPNLLQRPFKVTERW